MSTIQIRWTDTRKDDWAKVVKKYPSLPADFSVKAMDKLLTILLYDKTNA